jgi:hypothetical protein
MKTFKYAAQHFSVFSLLYFLQFSIALSQDIYKQLELEIQQAHEKLFSMPEEKIDLESEKEYLLKYEKVVAKKVSYTIHISSNGYFDVEEDYTIVFNDARRGIYRQLFLRYILDIKENEEDVSTQEKMTNFFFTENKVRKISVENIAVDDHHFDLSGNHFLSNQVHIRIGDEDNYLTGEHHYRIKYRIRNAFLFRKNSVDFYWNFLGGNWDMPFLDVDFKIILDCETVLDSNRVYLYGGEKGNFDELSSFQIKVDTVMGHAPFIIYPQQDLTILMHLPLGYVPGPSDSELFWTIYAWPILPLLTLLIFYLVWFKIGKEKRLVNQVQYYPPEGMDSAMAEFFMNSKSNNRDMVSLIPYFAAQGLLTMKDIKKPSATLLKVIVYLINIIVIGGAFWLAWYFYDTFRDEMLEDLPLVVLVAVVYSIIIFSILYPISKNIWMHTVDMNFYELKPIREDAEDYQKTFFKGLFKAGKSVNLSSLRNTFYDSFYTAKNDMVNKALKLGFQANSTKKRKSNNCRVNDCFGSWNSYIILVLSLGGGFDSFSCLSISTFEIQNNGQKNSTR